MSKQSNDELTARVAELEEQVRVLRELIDSFVRVDEETHDVTLTPNYVRCEVVNRRGRGVSRARPHRSLRRRGQGGRDGSAPE
jgi:hypothetical protein